MRYGFAFVLTLALGACSEEPGPSVPSSKPEAPAASEPSAPRELLGRGSLPKPDTRGLRPILERWQESSAPDKAQAPPALALVSVQAAFSGTSRLFAERIPKLLGAELRARVRRLDLLIADERNDPPDARALERWRARAGEAVEVQGVSTEALSEEFSARSALPLVLILDERSGEVLRVLEGAWPLDVVDAIERELARQGGPRAPEPRERMLIDERFTDDAWALVRAMSLDELALLPDPTNTYADDVRAQKLGEKLFFDAGFSSNGGVSCGSCHQRERAFGSNDPRPPQGVGVARRKAPTVVFSRFASTLFWDGRIDTLWGQATKPVEDAREMNFTRVQVLRRLATLYRSEVEPIFGALPSDEALVRLPEKGMPGMPEWDALTRTEQDEATRALVIYGKALAAFERSLKTAPLALDAYIDGDTDALTEAQKDGLLAFLESGCPQCHYGPRLTDDAFHVLRAPTGSPDLLPDPGRSAVLGALKADPMQARGRFSDAPDAQEVNLPPPTLLHAGLIGAFRTPALRGAGSNAPYGHGGGDSTLRKVVELHRIGGLPAGSRYTLGTAERWLEPFSEDERDRIVTFLESLPLVLRD